MDLLAALVNLSTALVERGNKIIDGATVEQRIEYARLDLEVQKNWIAFWQPVVNMLVHQEQAKAPHA